MLEYSIIISDTILNETLINNAKKNFFENSILNEDDTYFEKKFWNGRIIFICRYRYTYQGIPINQSKRDFSALVGWIAHREFGESNDILLSLNNDDCNKKKLLNECAGEYQLINIDDNKLTINTNLMQSYPVYYASDVNGLCISNRASLSRLLINSSPVYDLRANLELIAFDNILDNRTSYFDVKTLSREYNIKVSRDNPTSLIFLQNENIKLNYCNNIEEGLSEINDLYQWMQSNLRYIRNQIKWDRNMSFNLSGGKDSRLLLSILIDTGLIDFHSDVVTNGFHDDGEVLAALNISKHYGLKHRIQEPSVSNLNPIDVYFSKLYDHIFQMEGEISSRVLHGNHKSIRKTHLTGHEAGLRESLKTNMNLKSLSDNFTYIDKGLPLDPFGIIRNQDIHDMKSNIKNTLYKYSQNGHSPDGLLNWFSILGRGSRWLGKLTSMSSPSGLYFNIFCSDKIINTAHNLGFENRMNELFHFGLFYNIDTEILKYPFYNQSWSKSILNSEQFNYNHIAKEIISNKNRSVNKQPWWQQLYKYDEKRIINNIIKETSKGWLSSSIDFKKLLTFLNTENLNERHYLSLFSIVSSHLLHEMKPLTRSNETINKDIIEGFKERVTNESHIQSNQNRSVIEKVNSEFNLSPNNLFDIQNIRNIENIFFEHEILNILALNHDPSFEITFSKYTKLCKIILNMQLIVENATYVQLFYLTENEQKKYSEDYSIKKKISRGYNNISISPIDSVHLSRLRIDPGNLKGLYKIMKIEVLSVHV